MYEVHVAAIYLVLQFESLFLRLVKSAALSIQMPKQFIQEITSSVE
jgi:hypothetical protein